jgi:hypothetical protein
MLPIYARAHELRNEQRNQEMWLQGLYDFKAFSAAVQFFGWQLGGKKGAKPEPYLSSPVPITEREKKPKGNAR